MGQAQPFQRGVLEVALQGEDFSEGVRHRRGGDAHKASTILLDETRLDEHIEGTL